MLRSLRAERLIRTKQRKIQRANNCEKEVPNQVEREQEDLAIILHNQRMRGERKKRKQQKHLEATQEVIVGSDGGSNSSGMNEVKEVILDRGTNENDISEDAASVNLETPELQDSPLSSGFKIGKDLPGIEGDIPYPQRFASKGMKNVSLPIKANASSNTVDLSGFPLPLGRLFAPGLGRRVNCQTIVRNWFPPNSASTPLMPSKSSYDLSFHSKYIKK